MSGNSGRHVGGEGYVAREFRCTTVERGRSRQAQVTNIILLLGRQARKGQREAKAVGHRILSLGQIIDQTRTIAARVGQCIVGRQVVGARGQVRATFPKASRVEGRNEELNPRAGAAKAFHYEVAAYNVETGKHREVYPAVGQHRVGRGRVITVVEGHPIARAVGHAAGIGAAHESVGLRIQVDSYRTGVEYRILADGNVALTVAHNDGTGLRIHNYIFGK